MRHTIKYSIKHSIKKQMNLVFVGVLVCAIGMFLIINVNFLEPYYIHNKEQSFVELYENLKNVSDITSLKDEKVKSHVLWAAEKNNISFLVVNEERSELATNMNNVDYMYQQLMGYLLNQSQKGSKLLKTTDEYSIYQSRDPWNHTGYIEMWGTFDNGNRFILRSPLESIQESVRISNRFLKYIGVIMILICIVLVGYFSKKITDPISELASLSNRMANLDFDAKYTSGGENEIGELGDNFNRMSERLEQTISELKKANIQLQNDIEQKEKLETMRNEFLGNVSHELKTPIALIQGYAEGLREGISDDPADREFYCDVIIDEAMKMNHMVKQLLTLNQLEFGDTAVSFERFDLVEVIKGVLNSMEIMAKQNEIQVLFRQMKPVYVWADEIKVEQVLRNYMSNAFHHVNEEKIVEIKIQTTEDKARVSVFNSGNPIPEEELLRIWDKFYKVDKAHTREYGGNGIGLSIVKAIMESFHEQYGVKNYENGVEFWFELDAK